MPGLDHVILNNTFMPTAVNSINSRLNAVDFVYLYIPLHEKSFYVARINADLLIFP